VSKPWKPGRKTVELTAEPRPSRIRRDPVRLDKTPEVKPDAPEVEIWTGVAGMLMFGAAIATATIGIAAATAFRDDPAAAARALQFDQCYNAQGPNCVLDGGTIYAGGKRVEIAGLDAPKIADATCEGEHDRGVEAATELAMLLNSGPVTIGAPFRDKRGRTVSKVEVKGRDVARHMIGQDLAHEPDSGLGWCH